MGDRDRVFSQNVQAAGDLFEEYARRTGAHYEEFEHPLRGPHGERLRTGLARLGPAKPERMLVVISGTHGIEGHAGSAVQLVALERLADRPPPKDIGVLFVHLINPWGCAWNRRENEDNVDIFRNLVYAFPPFPENPVYDRYEEGINPRAWTGPQRERADAIFAQLVQAHSHAGALAAIRRGQHRYPLGITYHGRGPTWSRNVVEAIGSRHLAGISKILVLDIHTGYGAPGEVWIVPFDEPGTAKAEFAAARFPGQILRVGKDPLIPSHPRGPYEIWDVEGGPRVLFIGLEYGTVDVGEAFDIFRANTFIHTYGSPLDAFGRKISSAYRELFYPSSVDWQDQVLARGVDIFEVALAATDDLGTVL